MSSGGSCDISIRASSKAHQHWKVYISHSRIEKIRLSGIWPTKDRGGKAVSHELQDGHPVDQLGVLVNGARRREANRRTQEHRYVQVFACDSYFSHII
jgi:hypothetical protein